MCYCIAVSQLLAVNHSPSLISSNAQKQIHLFGFILIAFLYVFVVGFRYHVGSDWSSYYDIYDYAEKTGKYYYNDPDLGFYWLNIFASKIGLGFYFVLCTVAFLTLFFLVKSVNYTKFLFPFYFFFFFTIIFNESMNVMRQILAFFALFYMLILVLKKKYWLALLVFFIAWSFHKSSLFAIVYFIFFLFNPFKKVKWNITLLIISFFVGEILYSYFKEVILAMSVILSGSRLGNSISEDGFLYFESIAVDWGAQIAKYFHLFLNICIIRLSPKMEKLYHNYHYSLFFSLFMMGQLLEPIFIYQSMLQRLNYYLFLFKILLMAYFCYTLWHNNVSRYGITIQRIFVVLICIVYTILHIKHIMQGVDFLPYSNYLLNSL